MSATVAEGTVQKHTFKHAELVTYQRAVIEYALQELDRGVDRFAPDQAKAPFKDQRTPGCAINALAASHIIESSYHHDPARHIIYGEVTADAEGRKQAKNKLWKLTSRSIAMTWLERNPKPEAQQRDFIGEEGERAAGQVRDLALTVAGKLTEAA